MRTSASQEAAKKVDRWGTRAQRRSAAIKDRVARRRWVREAGFVGVARFGGRQLRYQCTGYDYWDFWHGVDTSGQIDLDKL